MKQQHRVLLSGMIGNGFEWYDFALYGQMAFVLGQLFFPAQNEFLRALATFSAFAVAFFFRPLGALFFGWVGDKYGRKNSLFLAILMMAIPTGVIGLLPTYDQVGIMAPVLLVIIRILQGISLGGEFGGAMTYVVEHSPREHRGRLGGTTIISLIIGFIMGSVVVMTVKHLVPGDEFLAWGWRIPFLLGILIGIAGLIIRHGCEESPAYEEAKAQGNLSANPVKTAMAEHGATMLSALLTYAAVTMPFYLVAIFFISYTKDHLNLGTEAALAINMAAMLAMLIGNVITSRLSDVWGRRTTLLRGLGVMAVVATASLLAMTPNDPGAAWIGQLALGFAVGLYTGPIPAYLVEVFPTHVRLTGMSLAFNGATVIFGGTTPMVCLTLLEVFRTPAAIVAYFLFCCSLALVSLSRYKENEAF